MAKSSVNIKITGDPSSAKRAFKDVGDHASTMGTKVGRVAKVMAAAFAAALAAMGYAAIKLTTASVKAFAGFDSAMTESLAIMGNVSDEMRDKMSKAAREIGKTTLFSAGEAAEAYYYLASAGMTASQSVGALSVVAQFGQAGMIDLARATELLADSQSALGLKSDDAAKNLEILACVSDVLVKANTLANAYVEQFAEALTNKAGAAMKAVGMDKEEGVAVLAAFAEQGIKGELAGNKFAIVLRELQRRAIENKEALAKFGVSVYDAAGELRNMGDIVGELEDALMGMSDEQKKTTLAMMGFSEESVDAILALLGMSDAIKEYEKALRDAGGTTEEVANKQMASLSAKFEILKGLIEDLKIGFGEKLAPALERFVSWAVENMPLIGDVVEKVGDKISDALGWVADNLLPKLTEMFQGFVGAAEEGAPKASSAFEGIGAVMGIVRDIFTAAWPLIIEAVRMFVDFLNGDSGKALIESLLSALGTVMELVQSVFEAAWPLIQSVIQTFIDFFNSENGQKLIDTLLRGLETVMLAVQSVFEAAWPIIESVVQGFITWFSSPDGQAVIKTLIDALSAAMDALQLLWEAAWPAIKDALEAAKPLIILALEAIKAAIWLVASMVNDLLAAWDALTGKMSKGLGVGGGMSMNMGPKVIPSEKFGTGPAPWFAEGGGVPGSGPIPIIAHGGEYVLTRGDTSLMKQLIAKGGMGGGSTYNVNVYANDAAGGRAAGDAFVKRLAAAGALR